MRMRPPWPPPHPPTPGLLPNAEKAARAIRRKATRYEIALEEIRVHSTDAASRRIAGDALKETP